VAAGLIQRVATLAGTRPPRRGGELLTSPEREIVDPIGCGLSGSGRASRIHARARHSKYPGAIS